MSYWQERNDYECYRRDEDAKAEREAAEAETPTHSVLIARNQHLMDVYDALGVAWGDNPFPIIARMRAAVPAEVEPPSGGPRDE